MKLISTKCSVSDVPILIKKLKDDGVEVFRVDVIKFIDPHTNQLRPSNQRIIIFSVMNEETETMLGLKYPAGMFRIHK